MKTKIARHTFLDAPGYDLADPAAGTTGSFRAANSGAEFPIDHVDKTIPGRFERIVQKYPDRLAIKMGDRSLSYRELNRAANRIARAILAQRGKRSEPIALIFEQGIDVIAAIFGVLKAGKFFVAIEPGFPADRISYILRDSQASYIVTNVQNLSLAERAAGGDGVTLNVDDIDDSIDSDNLALPLSPDDLVAIMYTSGSTGSPKGVVGTHRHWLGITQNHSQLTRVSSDDRLTLVHSVSFASAYVQLFSSLLNGASLWPFDLKNIGVRRLAEWLSHNRITMLHLPPTAFRQLSESLTDRKNIDFIRMVRLSGAPITKHDFDLYRKHWPRQTSFSTHMGSTEAGTVVLAVVDQTFQFPERGTLLGYASPDKTIVLVDDSGQPVAPGEPGEMVVKSRYLTVWYWGDFKANSAKLSPALNHADNHAYSTGDIVRMLPDGFLIHLGRKDFMVKIRGYRVELGEIESALRDHPEIREVVVAAWDREPGEKYLVAYAVPRHSASVPVDELRRFLKAKLPDYMIPSSFEFVDSIPLTNGKPNRAALPKPSNERPDLRQDFLSPRNEVERKLAGIWAEVLGVARVGVRDDFFDLGGHSLLAAKLFGRIEKIFGKELSPTTLLYARTIERLADIVRQESMPALRSLLVPLQTKGANPPFFWAGGYASDIHLPRLLGPVQPLYGLLNQCHDGQRQIYSRLEEIAAHHVKEIRAIQPHGPYYLGGYCFGGMVAFEMAQHLKKQGEEIALLFLLDLGTIVNVRAFADGSLGSPKSREKYESYLEKLSRHKRALAELSFREKLTYLSIRLMDRKNSLIAMVRNAGNELTYLACRALARPIPARLQLDYHIVRVDRSVMRRYKPEPYAGRIVHIKAEASMYDPELVAKLTTGRLDDYELPCNHGELSGEPYVSVWAGWLKSHLQKAQTPLHGAHSSLSPNAAKEDATVG